MAFAPGRAAAVTVDGVQKKMDSWSFASNTDVIDVSDYSHRCAKFLKGLPSGSVILTGPYDVGELDMRQGDQYPVRLYYTASLFIATTILVTSIKLAVMVRGIVRTEVTGVINADLEAEDTIHEDL